MIQQRIVDLDDDEMWDDCVGRLTRSNWSATAGRGVSSGSGGNSPALSGEREREAGKSKERNMATDATDVLGAPEVAGSFVSPKGLTKRLTGATAAGMVGGVVGRAAVTHISQKHEGAPSFGTIGYVAVTADEVAIVRGKTGLMKPKVGTDVVARMPRSEVASVELDPGMLKAALKIGFADGGWWEFEVPKIYRKTAEKVVQTLST
jgi:hypothetical protein